MNELPESSNSGTDLATLDYLRGVKSSTCLLLPTTPSPPTLDFKDPLSDQQNDATFIGLSEVNDIVTLQNEDVLTGDTSSSGDSNSVVQDPVSAQLINNISMLDYHTLSKTGDLILGQNEDCKLNGNINVGNRKLPSFVNWNWNIIRKVLLWIVVSSLIACTAVIVSMIVTLPRSCNPDLPWYQGKVFYEVFPASYEDSNNDGLGDIKGLQTKLDYIKNLGASTVRLNSIFEATQYPEHYSNTTSLLKIDRSIGTLKDFQELVKAMHDKNMTIILDIPVSSMVKNIPMVHNNRSGDILFSNETYLGDNDLTTAAISFWAVEQHVDGFYLKGLENFVTDVCFTHSLQRWKHIIGYDKILIVSEDAYYKTTGSARNVLLSRVDLIDINLDLNENIENLKGRIDSVIKDPLWTKPSYPWVHWNVGNVSSERLSNRHPNNALALTVLELLLPGTVSIFYGDEIGLSGLQSKEADFHEHELIHNLVHMKWAMDSKRKGIKMLPWNGESVSEPHYTYLDVLRTLTEFRLSTPTLYLRGIYRDGKINSNTKIRKSDGSLLIIERWYPRRNTCVFVANFGPKSITTDISKMFYAGTVIASTNSSLNGKSLYFDSVTFPPKTAMILKLEK